MENPFKFGTIVDGSYFTDRVEEQQKVKQVISSENHLILISPRRFGKTSLVQKVMKGLARPVFQLNLQLVTDTEDFASHLLKQVLHKYPLERLKHLLSHFRFIPTIATNPMTDGIELSFQPSVDSFVLLEDVFTLIDRIGEKGEKPIVVLDEFQEVKTLDKNLDKKMRSILQLHSHANYIFLGSQESMMEEIFEKKKSPFYHFGYLMKLNKIPYDDFFQFLKKGFLLLGGEAEVENMSRQVLSFTQCHPYYTQQLAFQVWALWQQKGYADTLVPDAILQLTQVHDMDYERLWATFNRTDKKVLIGLNMNLGSPTSSSFLRKQGIESSSTAFSSLKRLSKLGYVIKNDVYEMDDPFFAQWIMNHR
ncbi:ATP-binding protein [Bacteroides sp. GD17]|jgi:hypothetical protein|uniref:AAA family ATPase n=1 Tax=Bacteroides sp. GD17 TaxID=3139826 RepID=UPI0025DF9CCB|nr:ATP-binding protein [uncultured Bacteroides sp.]